MIKLIKPSETFCDAGNWHYNPEDFLLFNTTTDHYWWFNDIKRISYALNKLNEYTQKDITNKIKGNLHLAESVTSLYDDHPELLI